MIPEKNKTGQKAGLRSKRRAKRPLNGKSAKLSGSKQRQRSNSKMFNFVCPICDHKIETLLEAIEDADSGSPAHFSCILKQLEKDCLEEKSSRIIYRGQGNFVKIITEDQTEDGAQGTDGRPGSFVEIINYEKGSERSEWRKQLTNPLLEKILKI